MALGAAAPAHAASFRDVPTNNQFHREISWLADNGISTGWPDGTFRPLLAVNRDAMAAFLYRLDGSPAFNPPRVSPFDDVATDNLFYKEIAWLNEQGITTGWYENGKRLFKPLQAVNRDAMAAFLFRYSKIENYGPPAQSPFTDVPSNNQFYREISWLASMGISTGWDQGFGCRAFAPVQSVARDAMAAFMYRLKNPSGGQVDLGTCSRPFEFGYGSFSGEGTRKVSAGTYRSINNDGCYWERLSGTGGTSDEIIANSFSNGRSVVTVSAGDAAFSSSGCNTWQGVNAPSGAPQPWAPGDGGTFIVNWDLQPGTYSSTANDGCYWERMRSFSGESEDIIANDFFEGDSLVTISSTDVGFTTSRCNDWVRIY
ncbi:S-layer homology domain-containing protein [Herbiconiux sp. SYSU D00978]|uniref:S-layer homology domain-containing protein n=1 Tax=Herbiconiux sp. SYSU D00978 TaxID=2812562 RepID=UPI001A95E185|nr:S-layer homology domain-containing protein [Herbiconiux sp. SYSU D00978]